MERSIKCEHCGASVKVTGRYSKCEYCDSSIEVKDYKEEAVYKPVVNDKPEVIEWEDVPKPVINEDNTSDLSYGKQNKLVKLVILCGVLFYLLGKSSSDSISFLFLAALFFLWREIKKNKRERPMIFDESLLPWYIRTGWIIVIGLFTGGIYWFVGPIIRIFWKENRGY